MQKVFSLPSSLQEFIHKSRYAKYVDDKQRRESWDETVDRYIKYSIEHITTNHSEALPKWLDVVEDIRGSILRLASMPSMRLLMTSGEAVKRDNISAYNCYYTAINKKRKFSDILHILLNGTGVGFSCERQEIVKLPDIPTTINKSEDVIVVQDSKKGWSNAYKKLISALYNGEVPTIDYGKIRPAGTRLKVFGGRASGPGPLKELFEFTVNSFQAAKGRKFTSIEVHDLICEIASVVVVGGVRRSALISLSNLSDTRMREAKVGAWWNTEPQRALANNSAVYTEKPDMETFLEEWVSLVKSKSGERGIFSRVAAQKQAAKWGRRDPNASYGTNPCCVTGDTLILTDKGHIPIVETVGVATNIWNGSEWSEVTPFYAGNHETVVVSLSDGTEIICTKNHKFVLADGYKGKTYRKIAEELFVGEKLAKFRMPVVVDGKEYETDAYSQGFYSGDGNTGLTRSWLYEPKFVCQHRLVGTFIDTYDYRKTWKHGPLLAKTFVPIDGSLEYCLNWLAGILDSDGTVTRDKNGNGFQIVSVDKKFLLDTKLMLTRMGVRAKVVAGAEEGFKPMPDGHGGSEDYFCQESKRLLIGNMDVHHLGKLGLKTERLEWHKNPPQRDARQFVSVVSVAPYAKEDVYCFEEPINHTGTFNGIVTGQSEIILLDGQFCNLSEVVVRANDTYETLKEKVRMCTIIGTYQSSLTDFDFIDPEIRKNCEQERLLGVSMTGVMDHPVLNTVSEESETWLENLRDFSREVNKEWAEYLGINESAAITCNKPSGTVGQLTNVGTGGLHPRFSQYYIRTIRQDNKDPITAFLREQGVYNEPSQSAPDSTTVFYFPVEGPVNAVYRDDRTAIQQLEHWLMFQRHWCEHKPSITIYVKEHEWMEVGAWVYKYFDEVSGVSFLPFSDHTYQQAPFIPLTREEYLDWMEKTPGYIDWSKFIELDDQTVSSQELACSGGTCSI